MSKKNLTTKFLLALLLVLSLILFALDKDFLFFKDTKESHQTAQSNDRETRDQQGRLADELVTDTQGDDAVIQQLDAQTALSPDDVNKLANESSTANNRQDQSDNNIIEELSFAGAEDTDTTNEPAAKPELYCLDIGKQTKLNSSIDQNCDRISKRLASVSKELCTIAELVPSGCQSVGGFPLLLSEFAPVADREPQGRVLVIGGTHGDELTSVSIVFRWIGSLKKHHSGLFHWHMVPLVNPDGVLKPAATRTNKNGVDLNRNMPSDDWEEKALKYWKEKVGSKPRRYPGESAASEPETQWLIDEINTFKPDAIISVHAPYGVVDFDSLALSTAPKSLGKLHLNLLGTYPGSLGNYAGINRNIPVITLELSHAWVMPSEAESIKIWEDIVRWLRRNVNNEEKST